MTKGQPVANTTDFQSMVMDSVKAKLQNLPPNDVLKKLDPVGTHVLYRALMHGDGDFVRTWWFVKIEGQDDAAEVVFDMTWKNYNRLPQIVLDEDGEWKVVTDG